MNTVSPFRYPGGKASMTGLLSKIRSLNSVGDTPIAEPFAGGAGASLSLLVTEAVSSIHINDADPAIHAFWWSLKKHPEELLRRLSSTRVSMAEWKRQRETYRTSSRTSRLDRGFAAFYLNRCNRSGIIVNGGPIGGVKQTGKWKLDARFNKSELRSRLERLVEYRDRIEVSADEGIDFVRQLSNEDVFFFIDPPYFEKGPLLYMNDLGPAYHRRLSQVLRAKQDKAWVLTYDDCEPIRRLYEPWASVRSFSLRYAAARRRMGREIMITPKWMQLPDAQNSEAVDW